jgi:hypothetical protein
MNNLLKAVVVAMFVICVAASAYAIHEIIPSETFVPLPGADAEKLNEYLVLYNPYKGWSLWPGKKKLYRGTEPHGVLLTTFVNDIALRSIKKKTGMKYGSIIVKENYTPDKKFIALTVMYKIQGYNPEAGDWFWVRYARDGTVQAAGKVKSCIDCHSKRKDNDYIFSGPVK